MLLTREEWEIVGLVAVAVMLLGLWLNWRRQWLIVEIEEDVKNGKITSEQGWRRNQLVNRFAPAVAFLGIGMLAIALVGLFG